MTTDDDRAAAENLAKAICGCSTMEQHRADTKLLLEYAATAERRGIERAAAIADEHACQHCAHISDKIRNLKGMRFTTPPSQP